MLSSITFKDFKSYQKATLKLSPLTVLIGANASGKSNAVEALRLLSWIAQGNRLDSNPFTTNGNRRIRGTPKQLSFGDTIHLSFDCQTTNPRWDKYSITLCSLDDELRITGETLTGTHEETPLIRVRFWEERANRELFVTYQSMDTPHGLKVSFNDQISVLTQVQSMPYSDRPPREAPDLRYTAALYQHLLSNMVFLDAQPASMRGYSRKSDRKLQSDGGNLSSVLHHLCSDPGVKEELLGLIRVLPEQEIQNIDFIETPRDEVMVQLTETFGGASNDTDVTLLSDGTLRVLSVAAAVLSAPEGGLVVVEEIDAGVHPSRAQVLLQQFAQAAARRKVRLLTTSHDPALLDAVPDNALGDIVFCYRDPENGSSSLLRLRDIPRYPELLAQGSVGHLTTRGVIERIVKDRTSPEERTRRALGWLEDLQSRTG